MNNPITRPNDPVNPADEGNIGFKGLTKREHFAALALQGRMASPEWPGTKEKIVEQAVSYADALIEALNKLPDNES